MPYHKSGPAGTSHAIMKIGRCVNLPDGRVGRVQERTAQGYRIRVDARPAGRMRFLTLAPNSDRLLSTRLDEPRRIQVYLKST
jgi:hypothetical protein